MLFPSVVAQGCSTRDDVSSYFERRVAVERQVCPRLIEIDLESSKLSLQVNRVPKEDLSKKLAPYASDQSLHERMRGGRVWNRLHLVNLEDPKANRNYKRPFGDGGEVSNRGTAKFGPLVTDIGWAGVAVGLPHTSGAPTRRERQADRSD